MTGRLRRSGLRMNSAASESSLPDSEAALPCLVLRTFLRTVERIGGQIEIQGSHYFPPDDNIEVITT